MTQSSCPVCRSARLELAWLRPRRRPGADVLRCTECAVAFLETFPEPAARRAAYQEDYYEEGSGARFLGPLERVVRWFREGRRRDILRRLPPARSGARDALLDVGCGRGLLLDAFRRWGWEAHGTQLSETAARAASARGNVVHLGELPELGLQASSYRAIAFYHVLEHLERPLDHLREAHRLLRDDGLLVVEVPDASSLGFRCLGTRDLTYDYPHHLFFFTPAALRGLVLRAGFEVSAQSRISLEHGPFTTLQNLLNLLPGEPQRFYRALMRNAEGRRLRRQPLTWLHALLGVALAAPALARTLAGALAGSGNVLRLYCRKAACVQVEACARLPALAEAAPA
jgi:SAM-dependent methyltransferase